MKSKDPSYETQHKKSKTKVRCAEVRVSLLAVTRSGKPPHFGKKMLDADFLDLDSNF